MEVSPKPDTLIRIFLSIKKIDEPVNIKEQKLESLINKVNITQKNKIKNNLILIID